MGSLLSWFSVSSSIGLLALPRQMLENGGGGEALPGDGVLGEDIASG